MGMPSELTSKASVNFVTNIKLNSVGAKTQPFSTLLVTWKCFELAPLLSTLNSEYTDMIK